MRERRVWFGETGFAACGVHWRDGMSAGATLTGPAIVEAVDATVVIPPGWTAAIDPRGYLRIRRS